MSRFEFLQSIIGTYNRLLQVVQSVLKQLASYPGRPSFRFRSVRDIRIYNRIDYACCLFCISRSEGKSDNVTNILATDLQTLQKLFNSSPLKNSLCLNGRFISRKPRALRATITEISNKFRVVR